MAKDDRNETRAAGDIMTWIILFVVSLVIVLVFNSIIFINTEVANDYMDKTLAESNRVLGFRLAYASKEPNRFDVVAFNDSTAKSDSPYVMRIIGLPEETIRLVDGKIFVNTSTIPLDESSYLPEEMQGGGGPWMVPKNCYFVLGDNRDSAKSKDSRSIGYISKKDIIAKVSFVVYPDIKSVK